VKLKLPHATQPQRYYNGRGNHQQKATWRGVS
jgi:hypothetical protein